MVNSGITVGTLLWAFELFPSAVAKLDLAIPESRNETPDLLDEVRWNLEWMLGMQDEDGGVWHKQTSTRFPGFVAPQEDGATSYVIGTGQSAVQELVRHGRPRRRRRDRGARLSTV